MSTPHDSRHGRADGERRKDQAHALLSATRQACVRRGQRVLLAILLERGGTATADDVRGAIEVPANVNPVCLGAVPGALARAKIIERAGFAATCRPDAHARPVSVWKLRDPTAAAQWLIDNPEPAEPPPNDEKAQRQRELPLGG